MKIRIYFLMILFLLFSLGTAGTPDTQKPQWKGKIVYEKGIKVIKNPREPLFGEIVFELEEDLSIGNEDDENYMFYKGIYIEVDNEGNIFALDRGNCRVQKFDRNGNYLQTIGRKGQGPGEFEHPSFIFLDSDGNIYVNDVYKGIHIFDRKGQFKKSIPLGGTLIHAFGIMEKGNIIAHASLLSGLNKDTQDIVNINAQGQKTKIFEYFPSSHFNVQTGYQSIKRFKIKNWNQMKEYRP